MTTINIFFEAEIGGFPLFHKGREMVLLSLTSTNLNYFSLEVLPGM